MEILGRKPDESDLIGRKTVIRILLSFGGVFLFSLLIIVGLMSISARGQNETARENSRNLVEALLKEKMSHMMQLNISHSYWDEAVDNLAYKVNTDWADKNIGAYLFQASGITATHVVDLEEKTTYSMILGVTGGQNAREFYGEDFSKLVNLVRKSAVYDGLGLIYGFTKNNGELYLTTGSLLKDESRAHAKANGISSSRILIFSKKIDKIFIHKLELSFDLTNLKVSRDENDILTEKISLTNITDEAIGFLTWDLELPGDEMLLWVLPASGGVIVLYILVMIFVYQQTGDIEMALSTESKQARKYEAAYLETENRFKAFIDNTPSAIMMKDADGRYLVANNTWNEWLNPDHVDINGLKAVDLMPEITAKNFLDDDDAILEGAENIFREHQLTVADGREISLLSQKFPIKNAMGQVIAIGMLGTDISDRKEIEKGLREAKHTAELANKSKSEFLANMSHELRTPLNAILGFSDILKAEAFGPLGQKNYLEYAHDIHSAGAHLLEVINEVLDVAKIESGQMTLSEQHFDIRSVMTSCQRMVEVRASDADVKLIFNVAAGLPTLYADETRIKQIVINLLSNAVKFTDPGGSITVSTSMTATGDMKLVVEDTGIGIKESDMKSVLSQFGQAQSGYSRNHEGTGLGLTLVQLLVAAHSGGFNLESTFGVGTTVTLLFPASRMKVAA